MNTKQLLEKLYQRENLSSEEVQFLLESIVTNEMTDAQIAAFLIGLRMKGESVEEISGLIQGMRKHIILFPEFENAIDTCGTGGDGSGTFNISTTVAFVVAGAGVTVAKHGNKAASSKCGSADVLSELGVNIMLQPAQAKEVLEKVGMVFLFAPLFHPPMKRIGPIRKELGTRTVFNFLGPFLNPAKVKRQLIGVPNMELAKTLAQVGVRLGYEHLLLVTSDSGMDEIALSGTTQLFEIKNEKVTQKTVNPQELGFTNVSLNEISGGSISENAKIITDILNGVKNANRDIVVLNSAYALLVSGKVSNVKEGIILAEKSLDSGAAKKILEYLRKETKKYAK